MNKRLGTFIAIALVSTSLSIPANAAVKAGRHAKPKD